MRCEKCGKETWSKEMVQTKTLKLLGDHIAELCLPCQRAWNRLVSKSPEYLRLKRDEFWREMLVAMAQGCTRDTLNNIESDNVIERIEGGNRYFMALSEKWLAEKPKAGTPRQISQAECDRLNAHQQRPDVHPYTCFYDSNHRPLKAHPDGWYCEDCDYYQPYSDELRIVALPPKAEEAHNENA